MALSAYCFMKLMTYLLNKEYNRHESDETKSTSVYEDEAFSFLKKTRPRIK